MLLLTIFEKGVSDIYFSWDPSHYRVSWKRLWCFEKVKLTYTIIYSIESRVFSGACGRVRWQSCAGHMGEKLIFLSSKFRLGKDLQGPRRGDLGDMSHGEHLMMLKRFSHNSELPWMQQDTWPKGTAHNECFAPLGEPPVTSLEIRPGCLVRA